jgi:glycosyltransferase involved in cell wall biosynthesis
MSRMKTVFLDQSGQLGGAELLLLDLIPQMEVEPRVVLLEDGPFRVALEARGIPAQVVNLKEHLPTEVTKRAGLFTLLRSLPGLWSAISQITGTLRGADMIYANTPKAWIMGAVAARRTGVPLICHLHDIISAGHFSAVNRFLLVRAANGAAQAVIANSGAAARAFVEAGGNERLVKVIPNGFNPDAFDNHGAIRPSALRKEFRIGNAPLVAMAGRLTPWKGQHIFIRAIAELFGVHGVIVGDALFTAEDRAYAQSLPALAKSLGCADRIHFLGFRDAVMPVLREADVVAHCSVQPEPFGRVIVEAMFCGRPVVVAGEGGAAEIVKHGVTGLHHLPGDAVSLAFRLRGLLDHPDTALALARAGEHAAKERYSLDHVAAQTKDVLKTALQRHGRTGRAATHNAGLHPVQAAKAPSLP